MGKSLKIRRIQARRKSIERNQTIGISFIVAIVAIVGTIFGIRTYKRNRLVNGYFELAKISNAQNTIGFISDAEKLKNLPYKDIKILYEFIFDYIAKLKVISQVPKSLQDEIVRIYTENEFTLPS